MKKRLFISLMVVVLTVIALPFNTEEVQANSESANFTGSACTSDDNAAATIDYVKSEYKHMSRYNGPGQCCLVSAKKYEKTSPKTAFDIHSQT